MCARPRSRLHSVAEASASWVAVLDADRRLLLLSEGLATLSGYPLDDLLGLTAEFASSADPDTPQGFVDALCPPESVLTGEADTRPVTLIDASGKRHNCNAVEWPIRGPQSSLDVVQIVSLLRPATKRKTSTPSTSALEHHAALAAARQTLKRLYGIGGLLGSGPGMRRVFRQIQLLRATPAPALICGEPGTGKQHVARVICGETDGPVRAFVPLDCASADATELAQTIERLATPPAVDDLPSQSLRPRAVYLAHVDACPREVQASLMTLFSGGDAPPFQLLAGTRLRRDDLAASEALTAEFSELLTGVVIELPPLRERFEDLPLLTQAFVERGNRFAERRLDGMTAEVLDEFREYQWPGNLTELLRVISEARDRCAGPLVTPDDLPWHFRAGMMAQIIGPERPDEQLVPLDELLERAEREHLLRALELCEGNRTEAAKRLGIPRAKLYRRLDAYDIGKDDEA